MAEGIEKTADTVTGSVLDLGDALHDNLVVANVTDPKDSADRKYAASLTSVSREQELHLDQQV